MAKEMTSLERVMTTLSHKEPDRVPLFLLLSTYGAKELGISIKEYFSRWENIVQAQLRMREKYKNDCIYAFYYAAIEIEAWGGEVIYFDDCPPNAGEPVIKNPQSIFSMKPPRVKDTACLVKVLKSIEQLKLKAGSQVPIIGVVISPFSLPAMQMGFEKYLDVMYGQPELFKRLMKINEDFCVEWANAQLEAGAATICYFNPVSSTTITSRDMYLKTGFEVDKQTISKIKGPVAVHMGSGRCIPIIDDLADTGAVAIGVSSMEDIGEIKKMSKGRLTVVGNLNGIEMCSWNQADAELEVKKIMRSAGNGGGFIISDNHGEIPFQVEEDTLLSISGAVNRWGQYPINWI